MSRRLTPVLAWQAKIGQGTPVSVDAGCCSSRARLRREARSQRRPRRAAFRIAPHGESSRTPAARSAVRCSPRNGARGVTHAAGPSLARSGYAGSKSDRRERIAVDYGASGLPVARARRPRLRIAASHDLVLAEVKETWQSVNGVEVTFHGSADSLALFRTRRADIAGFHVSVATSVSDPLLALLHPGRHVVVRFLTREQGLMVPAAIRRAYARSKIWRPADFHRQPANRLGDAAAHRPPPPRSRRRKDHVRGYGSEEFTHGAVAATVAAGRADAGLVFSGGFKFGLDFVPLVVERYVFACRRALVEGADFAAFRALLAAPATQAVIGSMQGYEPDGPGELGSGSPRDRLKLSRAPRERAVRLVAPECHQRQKLHPVRRTLLLARPFLWPDSCMRPVDGGGATARGR